MHAIVDEPWKWPTSWPPGQRVGQLDAASRPMRLREGQPGVTGRRPVVTWCWPSGLASWGAVQSVGRVGCSKAGSSTLIRRLRRRGTTFGSQKERTLKVANQLATLSSRLASSTRGLEGGLRHTGCCAP